MIYDVEMTGKLGYTCHVFVVACHEDFATNIAEEKFPELESTGNTVATGNFKAA